MYEKNNIVAFYSWKSFMSNFHYASFDYQGLNFNSSEKFFMYYKALYFNDTETAKKILGEMAPGTCKYLGRQVKNFDNEEWNKVKENVMFNACLQKFKQNSSLARKLLETGDAVLAEASPKDTEWGIGIAIFDNRAYDPRHWKGKNLLGKTLMHIRELMRTKAKEIYHDREEVLPYVLPAYAQREES